MDPFDSLGGHYSLQTSSEIRSDLRFEISDLNYLHIHVHIAYMIWTFFDSLGGHYGLRYGRSVSFLIKSFHMILRRLRTSIKQRAFLNYGYVGH